MRIYSIFPSCDGEVNRFHQGRLTTFVRFSGCNFDKSFGKHPCTYCDTGYALSPTSGIEMTIDDVVQKIKGLGNKNVTITGGEPLMQARDFYELTQRLYWSNYKVSVETNGSLPCKGYGVGSWVVDYKLPSSGCMKEMQYDTFLELGGNDFVKFVVKDEEDLTMALSVKHTLQTIAHSRVNFAFSPWYGELSPNELIRWLLEAKVYDVILNFQLHKVLDLNEKK